MAARRRAGAPGGSRGLGRHYGGGPRVLDPHRSLDRPPREHQLNADPTTQLRLLDLQDRDTRLNQLAHRAAHLPEAQKAEDLKARIARLRDEGVAAQTIQSDLERDLERAEADVAQVADRMARDRQLLDSGSISDPKQLQSIQSELDSLVRRQSDLEDIELEVMDRVDGARAAVAHLADERASVEAELAEVSASIDGQLSDIGTERVSVEDERRAIAAEIPADLLGLYDKIRAEHAGIGAAPLHRGACQGCRLALPPTEIEAIRNAAPDAVLRCEECRRILVRTPESGL